MLKNRLGKIIISVILSVVCMFSGVVSFAAPITTSQAIDPQNPLVLTAKSWVLVDGDSGNVLLENNSHEKLPIASITKVMSMLLVMEAIDSGKLKMDDKVPVSDHAYNMGGSQVFLKPGEIFTVSEMLKAVVIHSANDATVALAELVAGSEEVFVSKMNDKAKQLKLNDTNFLDASGLTDEGHYSSAYDVAQMSRELMIKHPKITEYTTIVHDTFRDGKFSLDNTNKLIKTYNGATGLKTGFTTKAGYCLSASAKRDNVNLVSVVLGTPQNEFRFSESKKLLDYGFSNYQRITFAKKGDLMGEFEVKKGLTLKVTGQLEKEAFALIKKGEGTKVIRDVKMKELTAPIKKESIIGEAIYKNSAGEVTRVNIVAREDIEKASAIRLFFRFLLSLIGIK